VDVPKEKPGVEGTGLQGIRIGAAGALGRGSLTKPHRASTQLMLMRRVPKEEAPTPLSGRHRRLQSCPGLHFGSRTTPVVTLAADDNYPHLFRITYADGWTICKPESRYGYARASCCCPRRISGSF